MKIDINKRLYIATLLAHTIEPPDDYVGEKETKASYKRWAEKLYRMADELIKGEKENEV